MVSTFSSSLPVSGYDSSGEPINLLVLGSGNVIVNSNSLGAGLSTQWSDVYVESLYNSPSGIIGFGYGIDPTGARLDLCYTNVSGQWIIGLSGIAGLGVDSVCESGSNFLVAADGEQNILMSDFNFAIPMPAGGLSTTRPTLVKTSSVNVNADKIYNNGSKIVAVSASYSGSWTVSGSIVENGTWNHNVGEVVNVDTGHKSTSYSFPGYGGSSPQVQRASAVTVDGIPTVWDNPTLSGQKDYHGIGGNPVITVNWV